MTMLRNIVWVPTTTDNDLLALTLVSTCRLTSIFDAYHAAACLLSDPEHTILSTDEAYDKIPRITRIDPRPREAD